MKPMATKRPKPKRKALRHGQGVRKTVRRPVRVTRNRGKVRGKSPATTPLPVSAPAIDEGMPSDLDLMRGIQAEDPDALSQLYDRYNGILKALILRVVRSEERRVGKEC